MSGRRLTADQKSDIALLVAMGDSWAAAARRIGCAKNTVWYHLRPEGRARTLERVRRRDAIAAAYRVRDALRAAR